MKELNKEIQKIKVYIEVNEYKINNTGTKYNEIIHCTDNNDNITKISFDLKNNILTRENKEIEMNIDFSNKQIKYHLKQENKSITFPIKINKLTKDKTRIIGIYQIENEIFNLKIEYKII
ncbi:MAG: hypothetical protein ACI4PE_04980 [Bacilli bacterium]